VQPEIKEVWKEVGRKKQRNSPMRGDEEGEEVSVNLEVGKGTA